MTTFDAPATEQVEIRDGGGNRIAHLELELAVTTPDDVLLHLKNERLIMDRDPQNNQLLYSMSCEDRELVADRALAQQGVRAGSVLSVQYRHVKGADRVRLVKEHELLQTLQQQSQGRIAVEAHPSLRTYRVTLKVRAPVKSNSGFSIGTEHVLTVVLPDEYPQAPPLLQLATPVLVPNCFVDGRPCLLSDAEDPWHPEQTLTEVVREIVELIQGVRPNLSSIANPEAAELWHRQGPQLRRLIGEPYRAPMVHVQRGGSRIRTVSAGREGAHS
jgi:ubiquitin-protein ligase